MFLLTLFLASHLSDFKEPLPLEKDSPPVFQTVLEGAVYVGAGTALETASLLTFLGEKVCHFCSQSSWGNECHVVSHLCNCAAKHAFERVVKYRDTPSSLTSWYLNQAQLSTIPSTTTADRNLLSFLQKRWLAKSAGFYSSLIDWVCPCFGLDVQVHPETTNTYARDPGHKCPTNYRNIVDAWKSSLPHPHDFPLILTRPFPLHNYFPAYLEVAAEEKIETTVEQLRLKMNKSEQAVLVDLSSIFNAALTDPTAWLRQWQSYKTLFLQKCQENHLNEDLILCVQRIREGEIGGIRLLPLNKAAKTTEEHHAFILKWVSIAGLSANRIELDRWTISFTPSQKHTKQDSQNACEYPPLKDKIQVTRFFDTFEKNWTSPSPQKNLMLQGTLQVIKGLLEQVTEEAWEKTLNCPTRSLVAELSFGKIQEHFEQLIQENDLAFFDFVSILEQIHANLSALLEIFSPFQESDFAPLYQTLLTHTPQPLQPFTQCALHSSAMTSLVSIIKCVEKNLGQPPHVLYGENTYFENIYAAQEIAHLVATAEATEKDLQECDLILSQFNPALRRFNSRLQQYCVENVSELLHKTLHLRQGKTLTVAFDCTFDFIDSTRMGNFLTEFQEEIERGVLNVICYRSGLKFDLFGMDNYCGAPFYMIHNQDPKWNDFDALIQDPVLQTDRLSFNWFCLAYRYGSPYLELYRKQVFDNTRALLNKIPSSLFNSQNIHYRVIPIDGQADPAFVDVKIYGKGHQLRGALLVGGLISMECMEKEHPLFYRQSLGFYHPNFSILFFKEWTTLRLTLGLDPAQVDVIASCFETIAKL